MKKLSRYVKPTVIATLCLAFIFGLMLGHRGKTSLNLANQQFEEFSDTLFVQQVSSNTLNLHYTLANPEDYGITQYDLSIGSIDAGEIAEYYSTLENCRGVLESFSYKDLNSENQLAWDILDLHFTTELSLGKNYLLQEMLSPSLGIQAQLPVLLAEYTFRKEQDIKDYLSLLKSIDVYFQEILDYQAIKSTRGLFMSDTTVDRITAQCNAFIADPDSNYLSTIFTEKVQAFPELTEAQKHNYIEQNQSTMLTHVIPAYQNLIEGLNHLKGTGRNDNGLYYFDGGREYYEYLLQSNAGLYDSVEQLQSRLYKQLMSDYNEAKKLLEKDPAMSAANIDNKLINTTPEQMLEDLQQKLVNDFPAMKDIPYDIKYVHPDLENYLSPAFYLTPPIDTLSPNCIHINRNSNLTGIDLYTTLAHEGFPGHLYQTIYFTSEDHPNIRSLLNMSGYIEGWATYIESYAYSYADSGGDMGRLLWLNRSINLCLYSLLDIGIHYNGWALPQTVSFLQKFGITDQEVAQDIFQTIVEDPGNYLKYYLGYLSFADILEKYKEYQGNDFQIKQFHQKVLEIGPAQFPVLENHLLEAS